MSSNVKVIMHCLKHSEKPNIKSLYEEEFEKNKNIIEVIKAGKCSNMLGWKCLTINQEEIVKDIISYSETAKTEFDDFVVLGVGGSALGAKTIFNTLCPLTYNYLSKEQRKGPRVFIIDNIDPIEIDEILNFVNLKKTLVNVVSKSGTTTESMAQFLTFYDRIKKEVGEKEVDKHFVFTTDKENGVLCRIALEKDIKTFPINAGVGGRFSVLSPVGLLPACMMGVNIVELLNGAREMQMECESCAEQNPAYKKAITEYALNKKGVNMVVTMPYSSKLKEYSYWYAQLLGESIGKELDRDGNKKNYGLTPVSALGATDQHSQLQLYMEGPEDKLLVFIKVREFAKKVMCESNPFGSDLEHLKGVEFGNLINAERQSTLCGLAHNGMPFIELSIESINASCLGQLFMLSMYEIAFLGELYNVDAYNQPGVEFGKKATLATLGVEKYAQFLNSCAVIDEE